MIAVTVLRELWDRRLLVAVGLALATALAILISFRVSFDMPPQFDGRQYKVGIASAAVLIDSPSSQVADLGSTETKADVTSLSARARLLANLMATSPLKDQIARRAGVASEALIAIPPATGPTLKPSPLETGATNVRATDPGANVLSVYVNELLPIITADAQAPTPVVAARISSAAVIELQLYLRSVAAADGVPDARTLVVEPLGPARSTTVQRGPRRLYSALAFVFVFGLWCAGILVMSRLARGWREVSSRDRAQPRDAAVSAMARSEPAEAGRRPAPTAEESGEPSERPERPVRVA